MVSVWEAIKTRRSIRKFAPDDAPQEMIDQMLETARLAPSASNSQPWAFLVVRDKEVKQELCRVHAGQRFIEEAPVVIVCFGNLSRYLPEARKRTRLEFEETGVTETLSGRYADPDFLKQYFDLSPTPARERLVTPAIANTYIAIEHMVLMATALGLSTCWVGSHGSDLKHLFDLPDNLIPVALLAVGYPAGNIPSQRPRLAMEEIVVTPQVKLAKESAAT